MKKQRTPYGTAKTYSSERPSAEAERVYVVPGFTETVSHNRKLVDALGTRGYNASTSSQPRRAGKEAQRITDPIQRQGNVVLSLLEANVPANEKVHAVAHSLGSAAVLRAAQEAPERFESITLMQPLGMVGEQSLTEMAGRVGKKIVRNQARALRGQNPDLQPETGYAASADTESASRFTGRVATAQFSGGNVIATQPVLAYKEAIAAGRYDITDDISKVTELGIPVHLVTAHGDEMFDNEKVHAGYEAGIAETSYSTVADPKAGHDTVWMQPERTAEIVDQLIRKTP